MTDAHRRQAMFLFLAALIVAQATIARAQFENEEPENAGLYRFTPTGLPAGDVQSILPAGAVLHIQLNRLDRTLQDVSDLGMTFLPEKTLPPEFQQLLDRPQPLVQLLTASAMGMPMDAQGVSAMLGVDFTRPVTLTFYPGSPNESFVLSVPVRDVDAFSMLLMNVLHPLHLEEVTFNNVRAHFVVSGNRNVPQEMLVLCSKDRAYFCASGDVAQALVGAPPQHRLAATAFVPKAMQRRAQDDVVIALDTMLLNVLADRLEQQPMIPEDVDLLEPFRRELRNIPAVQRAQMNDVLSRFLGVEDVEQALAIGDVFVRESYQVLHRQLVPQLRALEGIVVSLDFSGTQQRVNVAAYSQAIDASGWGAPLSMAAVKAAAARLPQAAAFFSASGQKAVPGKDAWVGELLERVEKGLVARELPAGLFVALRRYYEAVEPVAPLESRTPWIVRTQSAAAAPMPRDYQTVAAYIDALHEILVKGQATDSFAILPKSPRDVLREHFEAMAKSATVNHEAHQRFLSDLGFANTWYDMTSRTRAEALDNNVKRVTMENSYVTRSGLFGFNEHELINRRFTLYREAGDYLYLHEGGRDPAKLMALVGAAPGKLPSALMRVLDAMPGEVRSVQAVRTLHLLNDIVDALEDFETLAFNELEAYLAEAQRIVDNAADEDAMFEALLAIEPPLALKELKIDSDGRVYALLPVNLPFPRPKVSGVLKELMRDFRAGAGDLGGAVSILRIAPGEWEGSFIQNTESLALLVRSVVNNAYEAYGSTPDGRTLLEKRLSTPRDRTHHFDVGVLENTFWSFMNELD